LRLTLIAAHFNHGGAEVGVSHVIRLKRIPDTHLSTPDSHFSIRLTVVDGGEKVWRVHDDGWGFTADEAEGEDAADTEPLFWMDGPSLIEALDILNTQVNWVAGGDPRDYRLPEGMEWPDGENPFEDDEGEQAIEGDVGEHSSVAALPGIRRVADYTPVERIVPKEILHKEGIRPVIRVAIHSQGSTTSHRSRTT
jgi:hypothetical protein